MTTLKDDVASDFSAFMRDFEENVKAGDDITYPIEVSKVIPASKVERESAPVGSWIAIRPVTDNDEQRTYLGVYLGMMPMKSATPSYHAKTKELTLIIGTNPAIFVPDLNRVVWGYESWWARIKTPVDLRQITNKDIDNTWYVKALRDLEVTPAVQ